MPLQDIINQIAHDANNTSNGPGATGSIGRQDFTHDSVTGSRYARVRRQGEHFVTTNADGDITGMRRGNALIEGELQGLQDYREQAEQFKQSGFDFGNSNPAASALEKNVIRTGNRTMTDLANGAKKEEEALAKLESQKDVITKKISARMVQQDRAAQAAVRADPLLTTEAARLTALQERRNVLSSLGMKVDGLAQSGPIAEEDQAQISYDEFVSLTINTIDYAKLRQVNEALQRMADGDYGTCASCDKNIPEKRLKALPWAKYCVPCQERISLNEEEEEPEASYVRDKSPLAYL